MSRWEEGISYPLCNLFWGLSTHKSAKIAIFSNFRLICLCFSSLRGSALIAQFGRALVL